MSQEHEIWYAPRLRTGTKRTKKPQGEFQEPDSDGKYIHHQFRTFKRLWCVYSESTYKCYWGKKKKLALAKYNKAETVDKE